MFTDPVIILLILSLVGFILWREYRHRRELVRILQERDARYEPLLSAAKESQARYRSIFENSLDGIFLTAPDGRILAANPAACRMLGRSEEEICRLGRDGVVDPTDPQVIAALKERSESGKFRRELCLKRKDGTSFPAEVTSVVFTDSYGDVRTSMMVRDITQRKQIEDERRESEARFRLLNEKMPAMLWATDKNLHYTYSAGSALAQVGLKPGQVVGRQLGELTGKSNHAVSSGIEFNRRALNGESVTYDIEISGRILHCDIEPLWDPDGNVIGTIGVGLDVTEHRQAERELVKLSRAIEQSGDMVIITDQIGTIEYVNPAFEATTGYSRAEAVGKDTNLIKSDQHPESFYNELWSTILSGQPFRAEFTNRKKNGDLFYEEKTITPIRDESGVITHYVSTGKDITERVTAYHTLELMVQERTREVEQLYVRSDQRSRELAALYNADEQLHRHLHLDEVLHALVDVVIDILHADKTSVQVWDEQKQRLRVAASRGFSAVTIERISTDPEGDGVSARVYAGGEPLAVEDMPNAPTPTGDIARQEGIQSLLSVPIKLGDQIYGVFGLNYCQPRSFSDEDKRFMLSFAQRAGMAITNATLYEQAEQAAIMEERQRMARDLHDSVTQSLYSLTLIAEAGRRKALGGDLEMTSHYISRLGETARQALKEMRLMLFEMRPADLEEIGLVKALQQRLDDVEKRTGTNAVLQVEGEVNLPEQMDVAIYRITQEALNNALKHANAGQITVHIHGSEEIFELIVQDDGIGYDPEKNAERGGMGLTNMRDRASQIGAELEIVSAPGQGTSVTVRMRAGGD
jgi:PAS domain S-box-containing protein